WPASRDTGFADRLFEELSRQSGHSHRRNAMVLLVAATLLVAVLAVGAAVSGGFLKVPWLTVEVPPVPSVQPSASEQATPSVAPTTASQTPQPSVSSSPSVPGIAIAGLVKSAVNA